MTATLTPAAIHPARFYPIPCWCACQFAHPASPGICDPGRPAESRLIGGAETPVCVPCASALDRRTPRGWT